MSPSFAASEHCVQSSSSLCSAGKEHAGDQVLVEAKSEVDHFAEFWKHEV